MTQKDYEDEEEVSNRLKNDLSLFNELSRENYDITELDDGADLTGKLFHLCLAEKVGLILYQLVLYFKFLEKNNFFGKRFIQ